MGARGSFARPPRRRLFEPNLKALATLGITPREHEVLTLVASGRLTRRSRGGSASRPTPSKTHLGRLYEKLEAARRTKQNPEARELLI